MILVLWVWFFVFGWFFFCGVFFVFVVVFVCVWFSSCYYYYFLICLIYHSFKREANVLSSPNKRTELWPSPGRLVSVLLGNTNSPTRVLTSMGHI